MGYYATMRDTNFRIPTDKLTEADAYVNKLVEENPHIHQYHFWRYVGGVEEALSDLGFETNTDAEHGLTIIGFSNKWREQDDFLDLIKSFVAADTYIDFVGEDGEMWRWTPTGTKSAIITWV